VYALCWTDRIKIKTLHNRDYLKIYTYNGSESILIVYKEFFKNLTAGCNGTDCRLLQRSDYRCSLIVNIHTAMLCGSLSP